MSDTANDTLQPCACCVEEVGTVPDYDLSGLVCDGCRKLLLRATAWLALAGIKGCGKQGKAGEHDAGLSA